MPGFKKILLVASIVGAVGLLTACVGASEEETSTVNDPVDNGAMEVVIQPQQSIVELAIDTPTLSTLVAAIEAGELVDALADESATLTVFAPSNTAFEAITDTVDFLLEPENQATLQQVLQYHVVAGDYPASALSDGQVLTTLQGEKLFVRIEGGNVWINDARVTLANVDASNGVVHVINSVLVPVEENIVELAVGSQTLSTLVAAVEAGELVDALSGDTMALTVFAPTNAAFADIQATVDSLLLPENQAQLQTVLQFHVVPGYVSAAALRNGQQLMTLQGDALTVVVEDGVVTIGGATVLQADIKASNGIVHVIDAVLVP